MSPAALAIDAPPQARPAARTPPFATTSPPAPPAQQYAMTHALDTCLDPDAMRAPLQSVLPECTRGGAVVESVRILKARRSSSKERHPHPLVAVYEATLRRPDGGASETRRVYAKVYRHGASAAVRDAGTLHLPALDMRLWPWPQDPGLPQLPALLDPAHAARWFARAADAVAAVRYEPERRATLRYTRIDAAGHADHLYAKTFSDARGEAIHRRFVHFWEAARADAAAPTVAEPLAYDAATHTLWQPAARGVPLVQLMPEAIERKLHVRTARALAAVHAGPEHLAGPVRRDRAHWLAEVRRRQHKISRAAPELAERAARVGELLNAASAQIVEPAPTLIHGDWHPEQLWVHGERIVLFDFDEFCLGDPMEDLAAFATKLAPLDAGARLSTLVVAAYVQAAPERFSRRRLQWHLAVQQLLQASRAFVFQAEGWRELVAQRLANAEALCEPVFQESVR